MIFLCMGEVVSIKILSKYCRKCGAEQKHVHVSYIAGACYVYCDSCGAETGIYATRDKAIEAWNRGEVLRK